MERDTAKLFEDFIRQAEDMNARIKADTEAYRKGRVYIKLKSDQPISGVKIRVTQKTHEFKFGANIFMLDELESSEKNETYKKLFKDAFNLATSPFYWDTLEAKQGNPRYSAQSEKVYRRPAPDLCVDFCKKNGIEPKLHCLCYDNFTPEWFKNAPVSEEKRLLEKRFQEISERYANIIPDIEVTNEHIWPVKGASSFYTEPDYIDWCYKTADKYFSNNKLVINEGPDNIWWQARRPIDRQMYYLLIEKAIANGARIDKIGMQYHIWQYEEDDYKNTRTIFNLEYIFKTLDTYSGLAPELQITEITLPAKGRSDEDEDYQAEVLEKLYRIWFSHKNMKAVICWNLVDGYAFLAEPGDMTAGENIYYGGLINFDMTPKKAYKKLLELTKKEWHTQEDLVTDDAGMTNFKGFYGAYEIEIAIGERIYKKEITLSKYAKNEYIIEL